MVEIFKTNIICKTEAARIISELQILFPSFEFNFDLEDIDNILRAEGHPINVDSIVLLITDKGFECLVLV